LASGSPERQAALVGFATVVGGGIVGGTVVAGTVEGGVVTGGAVVVGAKVVVLGLAVVTGVVEVAVATFFLVLLLPPLARPITIRRMKAAATQATTCFHKAWFRKRRHRFGFATAASGACPGCGVGPGKFG
jgi:hypothetical protein